jgi:RNA recognition motif-containing protein
LSIGKGVNGFVKNSAMVCVVFQVDYSCTPEEVQQHFQSCGTVNRVTILTDKFGQPKGCVFLNLVNTKIEECVIGVFEMIFNKDVSM